MPRPQEFRVLKYRFIVVVVLTVVMYCVWSGEEEEHKEATGDAVLASALELMSRMEPYAANNDYVDALVRQAHEPAFKMAYEGGSPGGRFRSAEAGTIDQGKYLKWLVYHLLGQIHRDREDTGKRDELKRLRGIEQAIKRLRDEQRIEKIGI